MKIKQIVSVFILITIILSGCSNTTVATPKPVSTTWGEVLKDQPSYPYFPEPGQHWVIDQGCNFDSEIVSWADETLEKLRTDGIAEVAVLCVPNVKDIGATNNGLIWLRNWTRNVRLGSAKDDRSIAFLIRPDIEPEKGDRIIAEQSGHLFMSVLDYGPIVENAADWANQDQFDGALQEIVKNIDIVLRQRVNVTPQP